MTHQRMCAGPSRMDLLRVRPELCPLRTDSWHRWWRIARSKSFDVSTCHAAREVGSTKRSVDGMCDVDLAIAKLCNCAETGASRHKLSETNIKLHGVQADHYGFWTDFTEFKLDKIWRQTDG